MGGREITVVILALFAGVVGGWLLGSNSMRADLDDARMTARSVESRLDQSETRLVDLEEENDELSEQLARSKRKMKAMRSGTFGLSASVENVECHNWCNGADVTVTFRNKSSYSGAVDCAFEVEPDNDSGARYHFSGAATYVPAHGDTTATVTWYGEPGLRIPEGIYVNDSEACERYGDI